MLPLDELKQIESQLENAEEVGELKPIYERLGEIARLNTADFDVQLAVAETRQRVIEKGLALKHMHPNGSEPATRATWRPKSAGRRAAPPEEFDAVAELAPPPRTSKPLDLRRTLVTGAALGVTAWLIIFVVLVQIARNRNMPATSAPAGVSTSKPAPGTIPVDFATVPPGASIQVNGEVKCKSNCRVNLLPGNYQVTAVLDGFDPGATGVTVVPGSPINVSLKLVSQTQTVRVLTDLDGGTVVLDGKPAGALQDGQLVLDRVANGKHSLRVVGKIVDVTFSFEGAGGKEPVITGPVVATNLLAVLVTSLGNQAKVQSSSQTPVKVGLNGQPVGEAGPQGSVELKNVPPGDQTLTVDTGGDQRKLVVSFGPTPMLTAFLKSDINTGTLVVSTGEDEVTVFLNGKEYRRKTKRGELRIQTVGKMDVRVYKPGFQPEPNQSVEVKKGEDTNVAFHLRPLPAVAAFQIRNGVPGTQILMDDRPLGRVGADGVFSAASVSPGDHTIEAHRDGFVPRRILRTFKAGETVGVNGTELALSAATGSLHITTSPPDAIVTYRRADQTQTHAAANDATLKLDPGVYLLNARAPNFVEHTERTTVIAGETHSVEIALAREVRPPDIPKPQPMPASASSINWSGWSQEGGEYIHRGGNRVVLHSGPLAGTITFTAHLRKAGGIFRGGKLRWFVEDAAGVSQFEVDKKKFQARGPDGSRSRNHSRDTGESDDRSYTIQIEVTQDRIVHRMKIGESWITMDSQPAQGVSDGRFGFVIPGSDEIAISNLRFTPK